MPAHNAEGDKGYVFLWSRIILRDSQRKCTRLDAWLVAAATVGGILVVVAALMWLLIHWDATFVRLFPHLGNDLDARPQQQQEFLWLRPHLHPMVPIVACPPSSNV
jgi:hypothetical protein